MEITYNMVMTCELNDQQNSISSMILQVTHVNVIAIANWKCAHENKKIVFN